VLLPSAVALDRRARLMRALCIDVTWLSQFGTQLDESMAEPPPERGLRASLGDADRASPCPRAANRPSLDALEPSMRRSADDWGRNAVDFRQAEPAGAHGGLLGFGSLPRSVSRGTAVGADTTRAGQLGYGICDSWARQGIDS
jgi:hypothetical protein